MKGRCGECEQQIRERDRTVRCEGGGFGTRCTAQIPVECVGTLATKVLCNYCRYALARHGAW